MGRKTAPRWVREALPKRCCNCGRTDDLHYHHIVPVTYGGTNALSNWAVFCGICHDKIHYGDHGEIDHGAAVRNGIKNAQANGVRVGRNAADGEAIMRAIAEHSSMFIDDDAWTEPEIRQSLSISDTCYHKYKRKLLADMENSIWAHGFQKPRRIRQMPLYEWYIKQLRETGDI